jgi:hypothetical protein
LASLRNKAFRKIDTIASISTPSINIIIPVNDERRTIIHELMRYPQTKPMGGKASKHLFCVSKHSWSLAQPLPPGGEASKLFVTWRPFLFQAPKLSIFTVSGSHLGRAATVWLILARNTCNASFLLVGVKGVQPNPAPQGLLAVNQYTEHTCQGDRSCVIEVICWFAILADMHVCWRKGNPFSNKIARCILANQEQNFWTKTVEQKHQQCMSDKLLCEPWVGEKVYQVVQQH